LEVLAVKKGIWLAMLALIVGCSSGSDTKEGCDTSLDCPRARICDNGSCKEAACANHAQCAVNYPGTFCWTGYDGANPAAGICSAIECKETGQDKKCDAGYECFKFLCFEGTPDCTTSAQCKQPAEKCYNSTCVLKDYCELDADCPSQDCDLEEHTCVPLPEPDVVEVPEEVKETPCDPEDYPSSTDYLCAPCDSDHDCGCGQGKCTDIGGTSSCTMACGGEGEEVVFCPSGYICQADVCKPLGGSCKGCMQPPGCEAKNEVCNFKNGECIIKINLCGPCTFDYECGFGNRCHIDKDGVSTYCAPECDASNFSCPLASGCEIREDGLLVCEYNNADCCYGINCEQECFCEPPTPVCDENNQCVQCLYHGHCPPGKPICDQASKSCIIQCVAPTPVYWKDPDSGLEYCVECLKSLDCAPGLLCGTFKNDPTTYHKCYTPE
jgi:hypothetical protein